MTEQQTETEGQRQLRRIAFNVLYGLCTCGRVKNAQGKVCCRMCRDGYGSHSSLCSKNNPGK